MLEPTGENVLARTNAQRALRNDAMRRVCSGRECNGWMEKPRYLRKLSLSTISRYRSGSRRFRYSNSLRRRFTIMMRPRRDE